MMHEADELELLYHRNAIKCFSLVMQYEDEFGGSPLKLIEEHIDDKGESYHKEVRVEYCDKDTYDYFSKVGKISLAYKNGDISLKKALQKIRKIDTSSLVWLYNFYDFNIILKKKSLLENIVKLNKLNNKPISKVENIEILQAKKILTVKEFAEIYSISKTSQQNYRARLHDPLPHHQKVEGGKITYVVDEVEKWFENQHK